MTCRALLALLLSAPAALAADEQRWAPEPREIAHRLLVSGDSGEALDLYRRIAEAEPRNPVAQYELGVAYATFNLNAQAIAPLKRAIRLKPDYLNAYQVLAIAYGLTGDRAASLAATIAAAELGSDIDMYELGMMHLLGVGIAPDPAAALAWLTRAAEAAHLGALEQLANLYRSGEHGVRPDLAEARKWEEALRRAEAELDRRLSGP